jgi:GNAT superfamily N-acetyltransferase
MTGPGSSAPFCVRAGDLEVSAARDRLDVDLIHGYLTTSYWAAGIPRETVVRALDGSLNFGLYAGAAQLAFARFITDGATFAYLADVFVLPAHRGRGHSKLLVGTALTHPALAGVRRLLLATRDAHSLYARFGFEPLARPERFMEIHRPDVYGSGG